MNLQHHQTFLISQKKIILLFDISWPAYSKHCGNGNYYRDCSNDIACYKYKLFIPTGNYVSPEYLAEEMQSFIDNFETGILKRANAHISVTYDAVSQCMKISAQNEKPAGLLFPKQFGQILCLGPTLMENPIVNEKHSFKFNVDLPKSFGINLFVLISHLLMTSLHLVCELCHLILQLNPFVSIKNLKTCIMVQYLNLS